MSFPVNQWSEFAKTEMEGVCMAQPGEKMYKFLTEL